ncbi:PilZ domain-containing protein [Alteromonas sp. ASW11-130]|uniref:PilZ domain-containing protein n=1 Tax=Alteromonas sp. ASW11-130 TaxID=3015775 RepID=UPI00224208EC|nr:PilZ domain-containing protein [Alteromonas sp. ASW11-130]MCW8092999.1 PilZ domain-containing protein [Alteromonas sp. ASW11-130]
MNQDLQQYADIIEQLKPMVNSPQFDQVLKELTAALPREKRFIIKMEMKRLARKCVRSIDLRGQVSGECELYEHDGIKHYLDNVAIETFERQLRIFGHYCFGVYEAVQQTDNNFRVMRERAESGIVATTSDSENRLASSMERYNVPVVNLLTYAQRQHERMNYAVAVELVTEDFTHYRGNSVDISTEGIRVKLSNEARLNKDDRVSVHFRGLEEEYALDKKNGIVYNVLATTRKKGSVYVALRRSKDFPNGAFDKFLEKFIHGNKRRYKVNLSNTIEAVQNKSLEQYFSPRSPALPIFLDLTENRIIPRFAMLNEVNREIMDYWSDEQGELKIGFLINTSRLETLLKKPKDQREIFVYSFTHLQNEKVYFYSASTSELNAKDVLKSAFLGFGSRKASWRVFKLSLCDMSPNQAHVPLSIPDSVGTKIKKQNNPPSARLMSRLKHLRYIVHITDVTSEDGQQIYNKNKFNRNSLSHLRVFGHARNKPLAEIKGFRYRFHEQRLEARYLLRSNIELRSKIDDQQIVGVSEDISVHGLRIELTGEFAGEIDHHVEIGFPKLQEMTSKHNVMALQYQVVHYNSEKNILHLKAVSGEQGQGARAFFDELIKSNRATLRSYPEEEEIPGMGHALRCINARNAPSLAFVLSKDGVRFEPEGAIIGHQDDRITQLACHFANKGEVNLEFMFRDRKLDSPFVQHGIKQVKVENKPIRRELFIAFDSSHKESRMAIIPRFDNRFVSEEMKEKFVHEALNRGQFIAMNVTLVTTGKPEMEMLQSEFNYVSVYAIHRAKELEEKMWSIVACSHLVDITDEVLMRYNVEAKEIQRNRAMTPQLRVEAGGIKALLDSEGI